MFVHFQEQEVRLFDKGEMNTYRDELNFVAMVTAQLCHLAANTHTNCGGTVTASTLQTTNSAKNVPENSSNETESLVLNVLKESLDELEALLSEKMRCSAKSAFLNQPFYQSDVMALNRKMTLVEVLSRVENSENTSKLLEKAKNLKSKIRELYPHLNVCLDDVLNVQ